MSTAIEHLVRALFVVRTGVLTINQEHHHNWAVREITEGLIEQAVPFSIAHKHDEAGTMITAIEVDRAPDNAEDNHNV